MDYKEEYHKLKEKYRYLSGRMAGAVDALDASLAVLQSCLSTLQAMIATVNNAGAAMSVSVGTITGLSVSLKVALEDDDLSESKEDDGKEGYTYG